MKNTRQSPLKCHCRVGGKDQNIEERPTKSGDPIWITNKLAANQYKQLTDCVCFSGNKPKKGTKARPLQLWYRKTTAQKRQKK